MKNIKKMGICLLMLTCIFCIVSCKLFEIPAKDEPQEKLFYEVVIDKADTSKNTAQSIADAHLAHRKKINEITDYKINNIEITSDTENSLVFMCNYSMKVIDKYHDIDSGSVSNDGWIKDKSNFFQCTIEDNKITLKQLTTSP